MSTKAYVGVTTPSKVFKKEDNILGNALGYYSLASHVGDYVLFAASIVDAYDKSLTKTSPTGLYNIGISGAAAYNDNYAVFGGGEWNDAVNAYDSSLTKISAERLYNQGIYGTSGASAGGEYAVFALGTTKIIKKGHTVFIPNNYVRAYNKSLTKSSASNLNAAVFQRLATNTSNHAIFGGGKTGTTSYSYSNSVEAYDSSLTKTNIAALNTATSGNTRFNGIHTDNYAVMFTNVSSIGTPNVYNNSLTKVSAPNLTYEVASGSAVSYNSSYVMAFSGGGRNSALELYNDLLTKVILAEIKNNVNIYGQDMNVYNATTWDMGIGIGIDRYLLIGYGRDLSNGNNMTVVNVYSDTYVVNDLSKTIKILRVGVDNIAVRVKKAYIGINNKAKLIFKGQK